MCVNFVSFAGISTSVKNMSLKRRVLSQRNPDPSSCMFTLQPMQIMEYILTPSLTHHLLAVSFVLVVKYRVLIALQELFEECDSLDKASLYRLID